ncbi:RIO1 family regulatory kinase/ATPase [Conservatibacter flavescens]|uniref:RIO1 family regulatory kinase/ATPase n=1 Tax=Conservatibacter flavescens TaxID=28161 RepID=UPI0013FDD2AB|nr:RIO1 family regulatory kinase/ATPase [Conservatibacter flavescens]
MYLQNQGKRICQFEYNGKKFWLKQPEKLRGIWRILKPSANLAFKNEIENLQRLNILKAAVPELITHTENYLVLEDVGRTVNLWIEDPGTSVEKENLILKDCVKALTDLHRKDLVHGRPALRDIAWKDGVIKFVDIESTSRSENLTKNKIRDSLVFIHGLFRAKVLTQEQAKEAADLYGQYCDPVIWQKMLGIVNKFYWIYYLVRPFRSVAGMDLLAVIRLFEYFRHNKRF